MSERAEANSVGALPTEVDKKWAERFDEYRDQELANVRESASKWQSALAGLSGLLMTGLALSAPFLAGAIQDQVVRCSVTGGVVLTLALLGGAGWLATYSAAGLPKTIGTSGEFQDAWKRKVARSVCSLRWATGLYAVAQVVLIATVVAAVTLSTEKRADLPSMSIVLRNGSQVCGFVMQGSPVGSLRLTLADGRVEQVQLSDVAGIQPIGTC